jgi:hypothetical protein
MRKSKSSGKRLTLSVLYLHPAQHDVVRGEPLWFKCGCYDSTGTGRSVSMSSSKSQIMGWWWTEKVILNPVTDVDVSEAVPPQSSQHIVSKIRAEILNLKGSYFSEDGLSVNYAAMGKSEQLVSYERTVSLLHHVDLSQLNETERRSFFINIYNALVVHALARSKISKGGALGSADRAKLYAKYSYMIGGHAYCLNDIENGILRGNRQSPVPFTRAPLAAKDPRVHFIVSCDPRIHFTLNCGARSCPPIGIYASDTATFEGQISLATEVFLDSTVTVDRMTRIIHVSKILQWYRADFGTTDAQVIGWLHDHASSRLAGQIAALLSEPGRAPALKYDPYDWSLNA